MGPSRRSVQSFLRMPAGNSHFAGEVLRGQGVDLGPMVGSGPLRASLKKRRRVATSIQCPWTLECQSSASEKPGANWSAHFLFRKPRTWFSLFGNSVCRQRNARGKAAPGGMPGAISRVVYRHQHVIRRMRCRL